MSLNMSHYFIHIEDSLVNCARFHYCSIYVGNALEKGRKPLTIFIKISLITNIRHDPKYFYERVINKKGSQFTSL